MGKLSKPRAASIPSVLPCGCSSVTGNGKARAVRMGDGSRRCRAHDKKWVLAFVEVKVEAPAPAVTAV